MIKEVYINPPFIKLEQFLKFAGAASTGGMAKNIILDGLVKVDDEVCLMRGKKLHGGEIVEIRETDSEKYKCCLKE
jgi:ribosome-associated protein